MFLFFIVVLIVVIVTVVVCGCDRDWRFDCCSIVVQISWNSDTEENI